MITIQHCRDYCELSVLAADTVQRVTEEHRYTNIGLPTGSTPVGMYKELCKRNIDWSRVTSYNLDEYEGIDCKHPASYRRYMQHALHNEAQLRAAHFPCENYDSIIESAGGLHLTVLGLGRNGHIAFNEPGSEVHSLTRIVELHSTTIAANSSACEQSCSFPRLAYTMGVATILRSHKILLLVSGSIKRDILQRALYGAVSANIPASYLQHHSNVTVLYCE